MTLNSAKRPPYCNSTSGFDFGHITTVGMSFCTSLPNSNQIGPPTVETWRHVDFMGPIMGYFKSPCTTSYVVNRDPKCLVFEKIAFLYFGDRQTNRQTDRQTDRQMDISTSGFNFDHITAVAMSLCTSLRNFVQIRLPTAEKWRHIDFRYGGSPPFWILGVQ